jgi:N-acetylmuramoyl-L-alanine amidase
MNFRLFCALPGLAFLGAIAPRSLFVLPSLVVLPARAEPGLFIAYPPPVHETTAAQIFVIGTAAPAGEVRVNGQVIRRSRSGNFAPSLPLQLGVNQLVVESQGQTVRLQVTRVPRVPALPTGLMFGPDSLMPAVDVVRPVGEWMCFEAIAAPSATVTVKLGNQVIPLLPEGNAVALPANAAVLTQQNAPIDQAGGQFRGCSAALRIGAWGKPEFQLTLGGKTLRQMGPGTVTIAAAEPVMMAVVTAQSGAARTGPSTDYSRLTPLPQGTRSQITGSEGDWVRLDYGAWIKKSEVQPVPTGGPPRSRIRSVIAQPVVGQSGDRWTEVRFPLEVPVPLTVQQDEGTFTLTLHNTTAQTDITRLDEDPVVKRLDWQQIEPGKVQYVFQMKGAQQWGYKLRYDGTTLVLSLKHPPAGWGRTMPVGKSLAGVTVVLDPGHGGPEDLGARGPNGTPEKDVTLVISKLVQRELRNRGAKVVMTRERDVDLSLADRIAKINQAEPTIALSLHYNALPDEGNAEQTAGIGAFWYQTQSHSLAMFLQQYLTSRLNRPAYGVFWNNLALTRPPVAPAVLLELGFMIHPEEFEWVMDPLEQQRLAVAIAEGVAAWLQNPNGQP